MVSVRWTAGAGQRGWKETHVTEASLPTAAPGRVDRGRELLLNGVGTTANQTGNPNLDLNPVPHRSVGWSSTWTLNMRRHRKETGKWPHQLETGRTCLDTESCGWSLPLPFHGAELAWGLRTRGSCFIPGAPWPRGWLKEGAGAPQCHTG